MLSFSAYPRRCGENDFLMVVMVVALGLPPQVRGEPPPGRPGPTRCRAYPRRCGENRFGEGAQRRLAGLPPQVRGEQ